MLDLSKGKSFPIKRFITTLTPRGGTKLSTLKIINVPSYESDIMCYVHVYVQCPALSPYVFRSKKISLINCVLSFSLNQDHIWTHLI